MNIQTFSVIALLMAQPFLVNASHSQSSHYNGLDVETIIAHEVVSKGHIALPSNAEVMVEFTEKPFNDASHLLAINFDPKSARFAARLASAHDGEFVVRGRAFSVVSVPMVTRRVAPGELISSEDIKEVKMSQASVASTYISDIRDLVGKEAKRAISPGKPIAASSIIDARAVTRGSSVKIQFDKRGLDLSANGKALQDGSVGENIRVVNSNSQKTISATVISDGIVSVSP